MIKDFLIYWLDILSKSLILYQLKFPKWWLIETISLVFGVGNCGLDSFDLHFAKFRSLEIHN